MEVPPEAGGADAAGVVMDVTSIIGGQSVGRRRYDGSYIYRRPLVRHVPESRNLHTSAYRAIYSFPVLIALFIYRNTTPRAPRAVCVAASQVGKRT